jgi:anti-sigma factor RsiW
MTDRDSPVTEDELHAYIDGELPADRTQAVEAWLAAQPEEAARVAHWRMQMELIRAHYGAVATEPVPARLGIDAVMRSSRSWKAVAAAAAVVAFLVGGLVGWMVHGASASAPSPLEIVTTDALTAHRLYIAEVRHPIEVRAAERHLLPWLSKRVGTALRAPDLGSFELKLLGGRLLPGPHGPAALFMYEGPSGERYTYYCTRLKVAPSALRYSVADKIGAVLWVDSGIGYVISGPADRAQLTKIAEAAYEQTEKLTR